MPDAISKLTTGRRARHWFSKRPCATLAPGTLAPEAIIDNLRGDASGISVGSDSYVRGRLLVFPHGGAVTIGAWSYIGHRSEIWSAASVTIGDRVMIAHDVNIIDTTSHSLEASERHEHFVRMMQAGHPRDPAGLPGVSSAPIVIEDDVRISFGAIILQGVRIGAGSVIAAGSLVTKDVPPGSLYRMKVDPIITPLAEPS